MKHRKTFTLLSGTEEDSYWAIRLSVGDDGFIKGIGSLRVEIKEERRKQQNEYYKRNRENILQRGKKYCKENRNKIRERQNAFYRNHKKAIKQERKDYRIENLELMKERDRKKYLKYKNNRLKKQKEYYQNHKAEILVKGKIYQQSEKGKEVTKRVNNRRKRDLGFNPLNNLIEGIECDAHHINKEDVVYIPSIIHRQISHDLRKGRNMKIINSIAYSFI